jgi:hypothetical protein
MRKREIADKLRQMARQTQTGVRGELFDLAGRLDRMTEATTPTLAAGSRTSGKAISSMATALPASTARY